MEIKDIKSNIAFTLAQIMNQNCDSKHKERDRCMHEEVRDCDRPLLHIEILLHSSTGFISWMFFYSACSYITVSCSLDHNSNDCFLNLSWIVLRSRRLYVVCWVVMLQVLINGCALMRRTALIFHQCGSKSQDMSLLWCGLGNGAFDATK